MSILSDLMGKLKKEVEKVADAMQDAVQNAAADQPKPEAPKGTGAQSGLNPTTIGGHTGFVIGGGNSAPSGSEYGGDWYDTVPAEECQYNFNGTYLEYFSKLFREEFPEYEVTLETIAEERRYKYTFMKEGAVALIVELMTEKSEANRFREECRRAGIPYLRFYFDHQGWWNTREYVVGRVADRL